MPQACYHYFLRMTEQTSTAARKPAPLPQLDGVPVAPILPQTGDAADSWAVLSPAGETA